ncbi:hypothetical protein MUN74_02130 [Agromyces endophyticus]|uniref:hypothetical protein n=1 Tax=Agromyces sp. H17E-10 TaxID=2932244 RepID=UPI001FD0790E|nr:hypothetical protein [Agromyces sp. H17E-10]UOQ89739.1 hypothetical protein MUN74_02130 [Agromyces sp. H17E-10]
MHARAGAQPSWLRRATGAVAASITRHPLRWGAGWAVVVLVALAATATTARFELTWAVLLALLIAPSLIATIIVLAATPRRRLDQHSSVFGHFFVRYVTLVLAFVAWCASIVLGATISTSIQLAAEGREDEVAGIGFELLAGVVPIVAVVLWGAFIARCAWFLARIRGWREAPEETGIPARLLATRPRRRRVVIGLAHPGLLIATGVLACAGLLVAESAELVLNL